MASKGSLFECFTAHSDLTSQIQGQIPWVFFCSKEGITEMRLNGKVKWFSNKLGYGFIKQDTGEEIFVHYSMIRGDGYRSLKEGQEVTFDIIQSAEGRMQAGDVEVVLVS